MRIKRMLAAWTAISAPALPLKCSCMCCSDASHPSMSSGLSPRDMRPRVKPWDLEEGFRVRQCDVLLKHPAISLSTRAAALARIHVSPVGGASCIDYASVLEGIAKDKRPRGCPVQSLRPAMCLAYHSSLPLLLNLSHEACVPVSAWSEATLCCCLPSLQSLAYHSSLYSRAQAMRKDGKTPANHGVVDDLPVRLAAEQLHTLAGMSQKVGRGVRTGLQQSNCSRRQKCCRR